VPVSERPYTPDAASLVAAASVRFTAAMNAFGGFEPHPRLIVAVSGGADSLALLRLAHSWAAARGGRVRAVTFDHRLRPESSAEAGHVASICARLEIDHTLIAWEGEKPTSGIEATARNARYAALDRACRETGTIHLLVGHHAGDQRETVAMRAARGQGYGRAGMAAMDFRRDCRLLRPLLGFEKSDLTAVCEALDQAWIEDPSNASDLFERNRMRKSLGRLPSAEVAAMQAQIAEAGRLRMHAERRTALAIASWARISPLGFAWIDWDAWRAAPPDPGADREFLGRVAHTIGGRVYPPARAALEAAFVALEAGKGATVGGCVLRFGGGGLWVLRENRAHAAPEDRFLWDGRFIVPDGIPVRAPQGPEDRALCRAALAEAGSGEKPPPTAAFARMPMAIAADGVCVPGASRYDPAAPVARFSPPQGATACASWLAPGGASLMY
jgi:tRNA(Ile)-lysidine synthase